MKIGIMQPYYLAYIGYWQLLNAVDKYVIYDDVNYIKGGWVNRNRILINGQPSYFNVPLIGATPFKKINEIEVNLDERLVNKNLRTLEGAYKKAPYFEDVYPVLKRIVTYKEANLAKFLTYSIKQIAEYLDIKTDIYISSEMDKNNNLDRQGKLINIIKSLGGTEYYNAEGGQEIYSFDDFEKENIKLSFLKANQIEYQQYKNEFQPFLSIVDVLMFNSKEEVKELLNEYKLITKNKD